MPVSRRGQDTGYSAKDTTHSIPRRDFCAVDFGAELFVHDANGSVPKWVYQPRGFSTMSLSEKLLTAMKLLLERYETVIVESPTVGSSGASKRDRIKEIVEKSGHQLVLITSRAVKNYRKDHGISRPGFLPSVKGEKSDESHPDDARILYVIYSEDERRGKVFGDTSGIQRIHTSVRPMDEDNYTCPRAESYMAIAPPFKYLPIDIQQVLGVNGDYSRSMVMPFLMAMEEPYLTEGPIEGKRDRYMRLVGAYDHGYPSFYRRAFIVWMQANADSMSKGDRKTALRKTTCQVREFFHLLTAWDSGKGADYVYGGQRMFPHPRSAMVGKVTTTSPSPRKLRE